jgi:hypothetical protein
VSQQKFNQAGEPMLFPVWRTFSITWFVFVVTGGIECVYRLLRDTPRSA